MNLVNDPASLFAVVMGLAVLGPLFSDVLGIPVIVSTTILGVILGPQGFGILDLGMSLQFLGALGLIFVFFAAGAELDLEKVRKRPFASLSFGFLTFLLPFLTGLGFGRFLLKMDLRSSLLMGAFFASSGSYLIPLAARPDILARESAETGRLGIGLSRLFAALSLFILSFFSSGSLALPSFKAAALQAAYFLSIILFLPLFSALVIRKTKAPGTADTAFILFIVFAAAALGPFVGVGEYLGAFFAGLVVAPLLGASKPLNARLDFLGKVFFTPFLLIFLGVAVDFSRIANPSMVLFMILGSVVLGIGSKFAAAAISGRILRYQPADRGLLFSFSSSFGIFSLAFAFVAGNSGLFDQPLVAGALILVVLSSLVSGLAARSSGSSIMYRKVREESASPKAGGRIMIALSKPATAGYLMELGIGIHEEDPGEPLLPCSVVQDSEEQGESRQYAETMLAASVIQSSTSQVSVIPISKVAINAAEGLLESAREQKADTIILGWNKPPRLSNAFFGSVIDQVLASYPSMILVTRAVHQISSSHIHLIVPPLSDQHPGFTRAAAVAEAVAKKSRSKVHLIQLKSRGASQEPSLRKAGLVSISQSIELESWKDMGKGLERIAAPPRLFMLFSARPSEPSWHPAIEKLPHRLGEEYPEANFIVIYMAGGGAAEPLEGSVSPTSEKGMDRAVKIFSPPSALGIPNTPEGILSYAVFRGNVRVNMNHGAIADGIMELVSSAFPFDRKTASRLSSKLTEAVQRQPIEMRPGVVLLHERVEEIDAPILCLGSHRQGFRVSLLERPVKILVIIFVPENENPETHLSFLGEVAVLFREKDLANRLLAADRAEDLK
ncbi:MAG: cation:proton antiporter [Spirochaetota bacterium]